MIEEKLFTSRWLLGIPGPTEFQISLFSYSGAFKTLLKVSPLSLLWTSPQVAQASVILKSNMTALFSIGFHFHTDFRVDISLPPCYEGTDNNHVKRNSKYYLVLHLDVPANVGHWLWVIL